MSTSTDRIEKQIEIKAPVERVWRAITDFKEFSAWFGVNLEAPFIQGRSTRGRITYPGYEHLVMEVVVKSLEPVRYFAFHWHPYAIDPEVDYSKEPPTLVEFRLEPTDSGTMLHITESGFDSVPESRRNEAFRMNSSGWSEQVKNIERFITTGK